MLKKLLVWVSGLAVSFVSTVALANWEYSNAQQGSQDFHIMWTRMDRAVGFQVQCINGQPPEFVFTVTGDGEASDVEKFNSENATLFISFDAANGMELAAKASLGPNKELFVIGAASGELVERIASAKTEVGVGILVNGNVTSTSIAGTTSSRKASTQLLPHCS